MSNALTDRIEAILREWQGEEPPAVRSIESVSRAIALEISCWFAEQAGALVDFAATTTYGDEEEESEK